MKKEINPKIKTLNYYSNEIYFSHPNLGYDGSYIYSDAQGYHYVETERGEKTTHKVTDDVFEISYWVLEPIVSEIAFNFESKNRVYGEDSRKLAFRKKLELFSLIGENFKKREEIEQSEILKRVPYKHIKEN
ncbi:Imm63 family immunity protein [Sporolactobacillus sp. Y61]|uniref:Imm63 family immunity protein n=1 Tax=Sporolactobacillus sp. Y61 TaxID=3160863 RepID=A0AAU8IIT1_9BACL